jgi:3-deoxy-D-manno-octulosonate 8-phosphate phosphatase (KDO 8-P phosphatase)
MNMEKINKKIVEKVSKIKLLLTDCDGVLTDGGIYYSKTGEEMKRFSVRDGMGVERLKQLVQVETGIITGENSEIVRQRVNKLEIKEYHPGSLDKYFTFKEILRNRNISADQVAYIGDDTNDLEIIRHAGISACPADALPFVKEITHFIMENKGGHGAFREFAEIIISIKQKAL